MPALVLTEVRLQGTFDPELHEAVGTVEPDGTNLEGTIQEVSQEGCLLNGNVLRHARVIVVRSSLSSTSESQE